METKEKVFIFDEMDELNDAAAEEVPGFVPTRL